jgi:hypothetical protein
MLVEYLLVESDVYFLKCSAMSISFTVRTCYCTRKSITKTASDTLGWMDGCPLGREIRTEIYYYYGYYIVIASLFLL